MCNCSSGRLSCDERYEITSCNDCETSVDCFVPELVTDVYLTTVELNTLRSQLELLYSNRVDWFSTKRFGLKQKCDQSYKKYFLYIYFLNNWQQWADGTTTGITNYATRQQFSVVINQIRKIISHTQI